MNSLQASDYMKKIFVDYWKAKGYPCYFQNIENSKTKDQEPYAKIDVYHTRMKRLTYTDMSGKCKYLHSGILSIKLFVPRNKGVDDIITYAEEVLNLYRKPPLDCKINFDDCTFMETTNEYSAFFQVNVLIDFNYEYVF